MQWQTASRWCGSLSVRDTVAKNVRLTTVRIDAPQDFVAPAPRATATCSEAATANGVCTVEVPASHGVADDGQASASRVERAPDDNGPMQRKGYGFHGTAARNSCLYRTPDPNTTPLHVAVSQVGVMRVGVRVWCFFFYQIHVLTLRTAGSGRSAVARLASARTHRSRRLCSVPLTSRRPSDSSPRRSRPRRRR